MDPLITNLTGMTPDHIARLTLDGIISGNELQILSMEDISELLEDESVITRPSKVITRRTLRSGWTSA
jgi:hypothetical protein